MNWSELSNTIGITTTSGQGNHHWDCDFGYPGLGFAVAALAIYQSQLIAAGYRPWDSAVQCAVAAWRHGAWVGIDDASGVNSVSALLVWDGSLIAAGDFFDRHPEGLRHIAMWDGSSWHPIGPMFEGHVLCLAEWAGDLVAGGQIAVPGQIGFSGVALWNGVQWEALGTGFAGSVGALLVHNGLLYAGGEFRVPNEFGKHSVSCWDGNEWRGLGDLRCAVDALHIHQGDLYAAGWRPSYPEHYDRVVARWDGTAWTEIAAFWSRGNDRADLESFHHSLVASCGGAVALWDGTTWRSLPGGIDGVAYTLVPFEGTLVVGGFFGQAGRIPARNIAKWID